MPDFDKLTLKNKYILSIIIPLLIILIICIPRILVNTYGNTIELEGRVTLVNDDFAREVAKLSYRIAKVNKKLIDRDIYEELKNENKEDIKAYAILEERNHGYYDIGKITKDKPEKGEIYLTCKVYSYVLDERGKNVHVEYFLDKYFSIDKKSNKEYIFKTEKNKIHMNKYNCIIKVKTYNGNSEVVDIIKR